MSLGSIIKKIIGSPAGQSFVAVAGTALTQAAAAASKAGNPIGDAAIAAAQAVESSNLTGAQKKAQVETAIIPIIIATAANGGLSAVAADAEVFAGLVVEEVVAGMKATPLATLATALLRALGVKL